MSYTFNFSNLIKVKKVLIKQKHPTTKLPQPIYIGLFIMDFINIEYLDIFYYVNMSLIAA